jgi:hypothetical protein
MPHAETSVARAAFSGMRRLDLSDTFSFVMRALVADNGPRETGGKR